MTIKTLEDVKIIDGNEVATHKGSNKFIRINHKKNYIKFIMQNGPLKKKGHNGCQLTALLATAKVMLVAMQKELPCTENNDTLYHLGRALIYQNNRTRNCKQRNVEGFDAL